MKWVDRGIPMSREEVIQAIQTKDGLRAGRAPSLNNGWVWVRVHTGEGKIIACEKARDCTEEEKQVLNDLLKGEIICRIVPATKGGLSWALASID